MGSVLTEKLLNCPQEPKAMPNINTRILLNMDI
jgi:hypothetical protein